MERIQKIIIVISLMFTFVAIGTYYSSSGFQQETDILSNDMNLAFNDVNKKLDDRLLPPILFSTFDGTHTVRKKVDTEGTDTSPGILTELYKLNSSISTIYPLQTELDSMLGTDIVASELTAVFDDAKNQIEGLTNRSWEANGQNWGQAFMPSSTTTDTVAVSAWVYFAKTASAGGTSAPQIIKIESINANEDLDFYISEPLNKLAIFNSGVNYATETLKIDDWNHVGVILNYATNDLKLFVNGVAETITPSTTFATKTTFNSFSVFGVSNGPGEFYQHRNKIAKLDLWIGTCRDNPDYDDALSGTCSANTAKAICEATPTDGNGDNECIWDNEITEQDMADIYDSTVNGYLPNTVNKVLAYNPSSMIKKPSVTYLFNDEGTNDQQQLINDMQGNGINLDIDGVGGGSAAFPYLDESPPAILPPPKIAFYNDFKRDQYNLLTAASSNTLTTDDFDPSGTILVGSKDMIVSTGSHEITGLGSISWDGSSCITRVYTTYATTSPLSWGSLARNNNVPISTEADCREAARELYRVNDIANITNTGNANGYYTSTLVPSSGIAQLNTDSSDFAGVLTSSYYLTQTITLDSEITITSLDMFVSGRSGTASGIIVDIIDSTGTIVASGVLSDIPSTQVGDWQSVGGLSGEILSAGTYSITTYSGSGTFNWHGTSSNNYDGGSAYWGLTGNLPANSTQNSSMGGGDFAFDLKFQ